MTEAEFAILDYLKSGGEAAFSRKEIARKAVRRTFYEENPHWADQALAALVARGLIENDDRGLYRIKQRG